ncbi:DUF2059 domain-containing protein [Polymorphum gilvum]|uniref:DUF2059 domain-containing protein n=1 Tax=Polymorphum gilvum (strain LMG 25793 / CGMCC 1.9160 / SL003B-26A1) TaxID=991905 RepID=F2J5C0_POLGS|nr:DUF2059 domain-containing protein [Polymorphum gilvum]ADZ71179.1 hypothetical protein SL003B_2756 [Polymorphum gilvum SL003B-26A1]
MKRKHFFTVLPLMVAAMVAGGLSVPQAVAQEISQSHLAAARRAVVGAGALSSFDEILPILADQTKTVFVRADPALTPIIDEVTTEVALKLADRRSELNRTVYEVWARRLTEDELNKIGEFYESDLGKKLTSMAPELTALSIGAARQWQDRLSTEMVAMVREELEKRGAATNQ